MGARACVCVLVCIHECALVCIHVCALVCACVCVCISAALGRPLTSMGRAGFQICQ